MCTTAAPARAASIAESAICSGVTGTCSLRPVVSPAPVTAQVMNTSEISRSPQPAASGRVSAVAEQSGSRGRQRHAGPRRRAGSGPSGGTARRAPPRVARAAADHVRQRAPPRLAHGRAARRRRPRPSTGTPARPRRRRSGSGSLRAAATRARAPARRVPLRASARVPSSAAAPRKPGDPVDGALGRVLPHRHRVAQRSRRVGEQLARRSAPTRSARPRRPPPGAATARAPGPAPPARRRTAPRPRTRRPQSARPTQRVEHGEHVVHGVGDTRATDRTASPRTRCARR